MILTIPDPEALPKIVSEFIKFTQPVKHFAFYGPMGAGKTTFIKEMCSQLNVKEVVTSPTFAIVNEYHNIQGECMYHFDFYRINKIEELFDLGYEDYLFGSSYCFIEWPEKGEDLLPDHFLKVTLSVMDEGTRKVEF